MQEPQPGKEPVRLSRRTLLKGALAAGAAAVTHGFPLSPAEATSTIATPEAEPAGNYKVMAVLLDINERGNGERTPDEIKEYLSGSGDELHPQEDSPLEAKINPRLPSVAEFYKTVTRGKLHMSFDMKQYRASMPPDKDCSSVGEAEDVARPLLEKDGIPKDAYDSYLFITDQPIVPSCGMGGVTNSDAPHDYVFFDGALNVHPWSAAHELGHRQGLDHARALNIQGGYSFEGPDTVGGEKWKEYGDEYDIMGEDGYMRWGFNVINKIKFGLVKEEQIKEITEPGLYEIDGNPDGETLALRIRTPKTDESDSAYYISYPTPLKYEGDDPTLYEQLKEEKQQVQAHYWYRHPLDTDPDGGRSLQVAHGLPRSAQYYLLADRMNGIYVAYISKDVARQTYGDTDKAYIQVDFKPVEGVEGTPYSTPTPSTQ
ncbi:MAG: twin-arginine translocation signal domain-containing protein [Candidatus Levybacteria bacterium]|nr:twin-arginine translocation signal domain-containing protein [Candidatus Levybacteria bacterium]